MTSLRTYLIVVTALLVIAIGSGVYVWYRIQTLDLAPQEVLPSESGEGSQIEEQLPDHTVGSSRD